MDGGSNLIIIDYKLNQGFMYAQMKMNPLKFQTKNMKILENMFPLFSLN